jgi:single-stranded DNA-binding protein
MNYSCFIIKIVSQPTHNFFENSISSVQFVAKFPKIRNKSKIDYFNISIWGNLADDIIKYYKISDYLIIEGYISLFKEIYPIKNNQVQISVKKIYPFLLNNKM